jgi:hypothetical protein
MAAISTFFTTRLSGSGFSLLLPGPPTPGNPVHEASALCTPGWQHPEFNPWTGAMVVTSRIL